MAAELGAVVAVGVDDEQAVAAAGAHGLARQHHHQVALAHARGGEDADVLGQARAVDADGHVDDGLAGAQDTDVQVAHPALEEREIRRLGAEHTAELRRQAFGLAELLAVWREVAEAATLGDAVRPPLLLVERMGAGVTARIVGQHGSGDTLGPARLAVLAAIGDVDDAEQVTPPRRLVDADEQLAEEQVVVGGGTERRFEDVLAVQATAGVGGHDARSMSR